MDNLDVRFCDGVDRKYMIIEAPEEFQDNYEIEMLERNNILGILDVFVRVEQNKKIYYYNAFDGISFKKIVQNKSIKGDDVKELVEDIFSQVERIKHYLLCEDKLIIRPEMIFRKNRRYSFCYIPFYKGCFREDFLNLMKYCKFSISKNDREGCNLVEKLCNLSEKDSWNIRDIQEILSNYSAKKYRVKMIKEMGSDSEKNLTIQKDRTINIENEKINTIFQKIFGKRFFKNRTFSKNVRACKQKKKHL